MHGTRDEGAAHAVGVGIIGAGFISAIYLKNLTTRWPHVRVVGVADLARAMREGGSSRVQGQLGYHVLEIMHAILDAAEQGQRVEIESSVSRPAAL